MKLGNIKFRFEKSLSHISLKRVICVCRTGVSKYRPHLLSLFWALPLYRDVPPGALDKPAVLGGAMKETRCLRVRLCAAVNQTEFLHV